MYGLCATIYIFDQQHNGNKSP